MNQKKKCKVCGTEFDGQRLSSGQAIICNGSYFCSAQCHHVYSLALDDNLTLGAPTEKASMVDPATALALLSREYSGLS